MQQETFNNFLEICKNHYIPNTLEFANLCFKKNITDFDKISEFAPKYAKKLYSKLKLTTTDDQLKFVEIYAKHNIPNTREFAKLCVKKNITGIDKITEYLKKKDYDEGIYPTFDIS